MYVNKMSISFPYECQYIKRCPITLTNPHIQEYYGGADAFNFNRMGE